MDNVDFWRYCMVVQSVSQRKDMAIIRHPQQREYGENLDCCDPEDLDWLNAYLGRGYTVPGKHLLFLRDEENGWRQCRRGGARLQQYVVIQSLSEFPQANQWFREHSVPFDCHCYKDCLGGHLPNLLFWLPPDEMQVLQSHGQSESWFEHGDITYYERRSEHRMLQSRYDPQKPHQPRIDTPKYSLTKSDERLEPHTLHVPAWRNGPPLQQCLAILDQRPKSMSSEENYYQYQKDYFDLRERGLSLPFETQEDRWKQFETWLAEHKGLSIL